MRTPAMVVSRALPMSSELALISAPPAAGVAAAAGGAASAPVVLHMHGCASNGEACAGVCSTACSGSHPSACAGWLPAAPPAPCTRGKRHVSLVLLPVIAVGCSCKGVPVRTTHSLRCGRGRCGRVGWRYRLLWFGRRSLLWLQGMIRKMAGFSSAGSRHGLKGSVTITVPHPGDHDDDKIHMRYIIVLQGGFVPEHLPR